MNLKDSIDKLIEDAQTKNLDTSKMKIVLSIENKNEFVNQLNEGQPLTILASQVRDMKYKGVKITSSIYIQQDMVILMPVNQIFPQ